MNTVAYYDHPDELPDNWESRVCYLMGLVCIGFFVVCLSQISYRPDIYGFWLTFALLWIALAIGIVYVVSLSVKKKEWVRRFRRANPGLDCAALERMWKKIRKRPEYPFDNYSVMFCALAYVYDNLDMNRELNRLWQIYMEEVHYRALHMI